VLNAARDITALGGPTVLTLFTAAACLFLVLDGKKHMALFVFGSIASGLLLSNLLKDSFDRPRPDIVPHEVYAASYSFPSGHSMLSAITYLTLGAMLARSHERKLLKAYFLLTAVVLTVLVGITRVYLGVHWPTDVLAGWTAGAGIEGAFGGGWSAKLEYLYLDLGKTEHTFGTIGLGVIATETRRTTDNIVRVGANYRWGG